MGLFRKDKDLVYGQQGLERFVEAQKRDYKVALHEVKNGKKETHWIWYVFPQMLGLGHSCYANLYGIKNKDEAEEYLKKGYVFSAYGEFTQNIIRAEEESQVLWVEQNQEQLKGYFLDFAKAKIIL